ncbi:unnamed protein product, partial [Mesorhabditis spiculigera]
MKFGLLRLLITLVCGFDCIHAQFYCADQIQRCAVAIEEYEKDIIQIKDAAFQQCFKRPACHEERIAYNRCFRESLRAVRAPFNGDLETYDNFSEAANRYRAIVDSCFLRNPLMAMNSEHDQYYIDVDAIYAKIVYSTEMTDRLWGLSEGTQSGLDSGVACMERESALRIFGSGIGRLVGSLDPKLNNLASSCTVEDYEVMCYRNALESSQDFQQLIAQRDYIMRQCIQQVRTRTICQRTDSGTLRGCLCQARDNFDRQIVQAMLSCVKSSMVNAYARAKLRKVKRKWGSKGIRGSIKPQMNFMQIEEVVCPPPTMDFEPETRYGGAQGEEESEAQRKAQEREQKKAEVRKRLEESGKAGKKKKQGFLTPERKKKLRKLLMTKAAEDLKQQQLKKEQERQKFLAERTVSLPNIDGTDDHATLEKYYNELFSRLTKLEEEKYDILQIVQSAEAEINELTINVNDLRGKFVKPTLKKVSKYDNRFKKLAEIKKTEGQADFRKELKTVKKENVFTQLANKKKADQKPDWKAQKAAKKAADEKKEEQPKEEEVPAEEPAAEEPEEEEEEEDEEEEEE